MSRAVILPLLALALALLGGCPPTLSAQSTAPPSRSARLDEVNGFWGPKGYRLELSQGVAIAITCNHGAPCEKLRVTSDDPAIAEVRDATLARLENGGLDRVHQYTASALVVVGKEPGKTTVRVRSRDGDRDIWVTVVAPPLTAAARPTPK